MTDRISLAYSPDTDDAFMVLALRDRLINHEPYEFTFVSKDIQHLNDQALLGTYDITAISMAVLPDIADTYALMPIGASIGDNFGPAIIVKEDSPLSRIEDLADKTIAVPGIRTSAYFAANLVLPAFVPKAVSFLEVESEVLSGASDAGILIHERQLTCDGGPFRKLGDLGSLWQQKYNLPLPLGANAIRRDLGEQKIRELTDIYRRSVSWAFANRETALGEASRSAVAGLQGSLAERYISMYVNERSMRLDADVLEAADLMISENAQRGVCRSVAKDQLFAYYE